MAYDESRGEVHTAPAGNLPEGHYSLMADVIDREWAALEAGAAEPSGSGVHEPAGERPAEPAADTDQVID